MIGFPSSRDDTLAHIKVFYAHRCSSHLSATVVTAAVRSGGRGAYASRRHVGAVAFFPAESWTGPTTHGVFQLWPDLSPKWPGLFQLWAMSTESGPMRANLARFGESARAARFQRRIRCVGQSLPYVCSPDSGKHWRSRANLGSTSAKVGAMWAKVGPDSTNSVRVWPSSARDCLSLAPARFGQVWPRLGNKCANSTDVDPPDVGQSWPGFDQFLASASCTLGRQPESAEDIFTSAQNATKGCWLAKTPKMGRSYERA